MRPAPRRDRSLATFPLPRYDCSSADINPIGGISKGDLKRFLVYAAQHLGFPSLREVVEAPPTAELRPLQGGEIEQTDEEDMGMTYDELGVFGRLRKIDKCGPVSMFQRLLGRWQGACSAAEVAQKVRRYPLTSRDLASIRRLLRSPPDLRPISPGEALLPLVRHQPAQAHHAHARVPCRVVRARRQPLRPAPVPLPQLAAPVRLDRRPRRPGGGGAPVTSVQ